MSLPRVHNRQPWQHLPIWKLQHLLCLLQHPSFRPHETPQFESTPTATMSIKSRPTSAVTAHASHPSNRGGNVDRTVMWDHFDATKSAAPSPPLQKSPTNSRAAPVVVADWTNTFKRTAAVVVTVVATLYTKNPGRTEHQPHHFTQCRPSR
jgi:hypothetical protein